MEEVVWGVLSQEGRGRNAERSGRKWNFGERLVIKHSLLARRETSLALGETI